MVWEVGNTPAGSAVQLNARVSPATRELLKAKAKAANMNVKDFLGKLIEDSVVVTKPSLSADFKKLNSWLNRINSNIYQLSKWTNIYKENAFADVIAYRLGFIQAELHQVAEASKLLCKEHKKTEALVDQSSLPKQDTEAAAVEGKGGQA